MRRGSNKPLLITVTGADVSLFSDIWVTLKQGTVVLTKKKNELSIEGNNISVPFTQEETLKFSSGKLLCQIKYNYNGVDGTDVLKVDVKDMLDEDIMEA